jgi:hypothetical protein
VVDLCGELQALKGHLQHEQWRVELEQVLQRQLPKLRAWTDLQVRAAGRRVQPSQIYVCNWAKMKFVTVLRTGPAKAVT